MKLWQWITLEIIWQLPYFFWQYWINHKIIENCVIPKKNGYTVLCRQHHTFTWCDFTDKGQTLGTIGGLPFAGGAVDTDTGSGAHAGLPRPPGSVDHWPHGVHPCVGARVLEKRIKAELSNYALFIKQLSVNVFFGGSCRYEDSDQCRKKLHIKPA